MKFDALRRLPHEIGSITDWLKNYFKLKAISPFGQLPPRNHAALTRYRKGAPIGASLDQCERVGHLLGIHRNLRLPFPQNRDLAYRWMSTRNKAFGNLAPVDVVKEWGFAGLLMVRGYLDRARGTSAQLATYPKIAGTSHLVSDTSRYRS